MKTPFTFNPVTAKEWIQQLQFELKGLDYQKTLVSKNSSGIHIKPFYSKEDSIPLPKAFKHTSDWECIAFIEQNNPKIANTLALQNLQFGANGLVFNQPFTKELIENIRTEFIHTQVLPHSIKECTSWEDSLPKNHRQTIHFDPITTYGKFGKNWLSNQEWKTYMKSHSSTQQKSIIDLSLYQNAGASTADQLCYALSHANEWVDQIGDSFLQYTTIKFAIGNDFFEEIAKLKAFRVLWSAFCNEYGVTNPELCIIAETSSRNKSYLDIENNILRTTTESMSAVLGGANSVITYPYDHGFKNQSWESSRNALHIHSLLREESYLDKVLDPSKGSYYVEKLCSELVEKAWSKFQAIEKTGGIITNLKSGSIQNQIKESHEKEMKSFRELKKILVGVNQYKNTNYEENTIKPTKVENNNLVEIATITPKRLAEKVELKSQNRAQ